MSDITLKEIIKDMKKDQEPGSTYYCWQSNIAMAIYDELETKVSLEEANNAAKRFLSVLINN